MAFDTEDYFRRNRTDCVHLVPYKDYRQPPVRKVSKWPVVALCGVAMVLILAIVAGPV